MCEGLSDDVVRLIVRHLAPERDPVLGRPALLSCLRASRRLFLHAAPVLWATAELKVDGSIRRRNAGSILSNPELNVDGSIRWKPLACERPTPRWYCDEIRAINDKDRDDGCDGGMAWRWKAYLMSVRMLVVTVKPGSTTDKVLDPALFEPWLGKLDDITVESTLGAPSREDAWEAWLGERWAAGNVPQTIKLVETPIKLAQELASHRAVANVWVVLETDEPCDGDQTYFQALVCSIKHGLQSFQIGPSYDMNQPRGKKDDTSIQSLSLSSLKEYSATHLNDFGGADLTILNMQQPIPEEIPVIALTLWYQTVNLQDLKISAHSKSLRSFSMRDLQHVSDDDGIEEIIQLQNLEILMFQFIESWKKRFMQSLFTNTLPRMTNLRHLYLHINGVCYFDVISCLQQLTLLESLSLSLKTPRDIDFDQLVKYLHRLESLILVCENPGRCKVGLWQQIKRLKTSHVRLLVDKDILISPGVPNLEYLVVFGTSPIVITSDGRNFTKELEGMLSDKEIAPRLALLRLGK
ncbi:hypothetical protein HK101_012011 [Irineochytrium annulatum]|nr:hypothetical protein HK101_012011 [Irineochytrium annulatum]